MIAEMAAIRLNKFSLFTLFLLTCKPVAQASDSLDGHLTRDSEALGTLKFKLPAAWYFRPPKKLSVAYLLNEQEKGLAKRRYLFCPP